jgi:hypothetical protein
MARNTATTDGGNDNEHKAADLETIIVDPDDVIEMFRRNARDETEQRSHVLRVSPPFEGDATATLHVSEDHTYYPPEMDPKPIHIGPAMFVGYESGDGPAHQTDIPMPTWGESRRLARDDHGDGVDEDTIEEYHEVAMEMWEDRIRGNLKDEIKLGALYPDRPTTTVEVRFKSDDA